MYTLMPYRNHRDMSARRTPSLFDDRFFRSFFGLDGRFTDFISQSALTDHFWLWIVALLFCMPIRRMLPDHVLVRLTLSLVVLVLSVALLVGATNNAFIYTRF